MCSVMWEHTRCRQQKSAQKYIKSGTVNVPWVFATSLNSWRVGGDDIPNSWQMTDTSSVAIPPAVTRRKLSYCIPQDSKKLQKFKKLKIKQDTMDTLKRLDCAIAPWPLGRQG